MDYYRKNSLFNQFLCIVLSALILASSLWPTFPLGNVNTAFAQEGVGLTMTNPRDGDTVSGVIYGITAQSSEPLTGDAYLEINGAVLETKPITNSTSITFDYIWNTQLFGDRTHEVLIFVEPIDQPGTYWVSSSVSTSNPPYVKSSNPVNGQTGAELIKPITLTFNENVSKSTNFDNIKLTNGSTDIGYTASITDRTLTITPAELTSFTNYTLTIPSEAVKDSLGNEFRDPYSLSFTTGGDITAPTIISSDPVNEATDVPLDKVVKINFSENIKAGANINAISIRTINSVVNFTYDITGNVLNLYPVGLNNNFTYSVNIPAGAIIDMSDNSLATSHQFKFNTPNIIPDAGTLVLPITQDTYSYRSTTHGAEPLLYVWWDGYDDEYTYVKTDAPLPPQGSQIENATLHLYATEIYVGKVIISEVDAPWGESTLDSYNRPGSTGTSIPYTFKAGWNTIDISPIVQKWVDAGNAGNGIMISPDGEINLKITSSNGAEANRPYISVNYGSASPSDTTAPTVVSSDPVNGATDIPLDKVIRVNFSENVQSGSNFAGISIEAGSTVVGYSYSISGNELNLIPASLSNNVSYSVYIPSEAIKDTAGNALQNGYSFEFSTPKVGLPSGTMTSLITEDAHVDWWENKNYGNGDILWIYNYNDDTTFSTYLKPEFALPPKGSTVTSATINVFAKYGSLPCNISEVTGSWSESTITGANRPGGTFFKAQTLNSGWNTIDITELVQKWVDAGSLGNGIAIEISSLALDGDIELVSSESATTQNRPYVTVTYGTKNPVTVNNPVSGSNVSGIVNGIRGTFRDLATGKAELFIDGVLKETKNVTNATEVIFGYNWDTNQYTNFTNHTIEIKLTDDFNTQSVGASTVTVLYADTTPPTVNSTDPLNNATNIAVNKAITINFNESVVAGTNFGDISLKAGSTVVSYTYSLNDKVLTLNPIALGHNVTYTVNIPTGALKDVSGNALALPYTFTFKTIPDTTAPSITSSDPVNWATNMPLDKVININFSENVLAGANFTGINIKGATVINYTYAFNDNVLSLYPTQLNNNMTYTLTIPSGAVADTAGNALLNGYSVVFSTPDAGAPSGKMTSIITEDAHVDWYNSNNYGNDNKLWIYNYNDDTTFSAYLKPEFALPPKGSTVTSATINVYAKYGALPCNISEVTGSWSESTITGANRPGGTFLKAQTLKPGWNTIDITELVQKWVDAGSLGNGIVIEISSLAIDGDVELVSSESATTQNRPYVTVTYGTKNQVTVNNPVNGSNVSGIVTNIRGTFRDLATGKAELFIDGVLKETKNVTNTTEVIFEYNWDANQCDNYSAHTIEIRLTDDFNTQSVGTSAVTVLYTDTTPPTVSSTDPLNNATNIAVNKAITIKFNESVVAGTNFGDISLKAGSTVVNYTYSLNGTILTLTPEALGHNVTYTVNIPTGALKDITGNALALPYTFTFKTIPDTTAPNITSSDPVNWATNTPLDKVININFSENVLPGSNFAGFNIKGVTVTDYTYAFNGNVLSLYPIALKNNMTYTVTVPSGAVVDTAGNALLNGYSVVFSTPDAGAPSGKMTSLITEDAQVDWYNSRNYGNGDILWIYNYNDDTTFSTYLKPEFALPPKGSTVTSATINVFAKYGSLPCNISEVTGSWSESTITGANRPGGTFFKAQTLNSGWNTIDITELVQKWVDAGSLGNGIAIEISSLALDGDIELVSSESATTQNRPYVTVIYGTKNQVTVINPTSGSNVSGIVNGIRGTFRDLATGKAELFIDGVLKETKNVNNATEVIFGYNWDTNQYTNFTNHTIEIKLTDDFNTQSVGASTVTVLYSDTTPLTVSSTDPVNNATNIAVNKTITINFNESVMAGANFGDISLKAGSTVISYTSSLSGNVLNINPQSLSNNTSYTLSIPAGAVKDAAGNILTDEYTVNFTTIGDAIAPTVSNTEPLNGSTGFALDKVIEINFSENILEGTNFSGISLSNGSTNVGYSASVNANVLRITPGGLNNNTTYTVNIPAGAVKDSAGNSMAAVYSFSFTTIGDVKAPTVSSSNPANGATSVAVNKAIEINFSEGVVAGANIGGISLTAGSTVVSYTYSLSGNVLTINPQSLSNSATYTVTIPAEAVKDAAGNGLASAYTFSFTTVADTTLPTVSSSDPANGATSVAVNKAIEINFSEGVVAGANIGGISLTAGSTVVSYTYSLSGNVLTINPQSLSNSATYTVTIPAEAVKDAAGNGLASAYTFSFTTVADTTPPTVSSRDPANGATSVAVNKAIEINFSEGVVAGANIGGISLTAGSTVVSYTYSLSGNVLTITPQSLSNSATYTVTIPAGAVKDFSGNSLVSPSTFSFTTIGDTTAPTVVSIDPTSGATNVPLDKVITFTFSEDVVPGANIGGISLNAGGTTVGYTYSINGNLLTITPTGLVGNTSYSITVPEGAFKDLAGNGSTAYQFDFTTVNSMPTSGTITLPITQDTSSDSREPGNKPILYVWWDTYDDEYTYINTNATLPPQGSQVASATLNLYVTEAWVGKAVISEADSPWEESTLNYSNKPWSSGTLIPYTFKAGWNTIDITPIVQKWVDAGNAGNGIMISPDGEMTLKITSSNGAEANRPYISVKYGSPDSDFVAPAVLTVDPLSGTTGVPLDKKLNITFSEGIAPGFINGILISNGSNNVPFVAEVNGDVLTISPLDLSFNTTYTVTIPEGTVVDNSGNANKTYSFTFTTVADTISPVILNTEPNALNRALLDSPVVIQFDETIKVGNNINAVTIKRDDNSLVSFNYIIDGKTLTLSTANLEFDVAYTVYLPAGAVLDQVGNPSNAYSFTFRTIQDNVPPRITVTDPIMNASGVPTEKSIIVQFSEQVVPGNNFGDISLTTGSSSILYSYSLSGNTLVITPSNLNYNTDYLLTIPIGAVKDKVNNSLDTSFQLSFTTQNDQTPPVLVNSDPANNATGVPLDKNLTFVFNENVFPAANFAGVSLKAGTSVVDFTYSFSGNVLSITPKALTNNVLYSVYFPQGALRDVYGNKTSVPYTVKFSTPTLGTVIAPITDDSYVWWWDSGSRQNYGNNPIVKVVNLDYGDYGDIASTYIKPDLSGLPGGTVNKATLNLYVESGGTTALCGIAEVTGPWSEQTITGSNNPGAGNVSITAKLNNGWNAIDITPIVQQWVNHNSAGNGLVILPPGPQYDITITSSESSNVNWRPYLSVTYGVATQVYISSPVNGEVVSGSSSITGNLKDTVSGKAELLVDGIVKESKTISNAKTVTFNYNWDSTSYIDYSQHSVEIRTTDSNGLESIGRNTVKVRSYPKVLTSLPSNGYSFIPADSDIVVTFDRNVKEGVYFSGISLTAGTTKVGYTYSFQGNKLVINPNEDFKYNVAYCVYLPAGSVNDIMGNKIQAPYNVTFTIPTKTTTVELVQNPWNGMDTFVYSGQTANEAPDAGYYNHTSFYASSTYNYSLVKFDLNSIPKSKIVSAKLKLYATRVPNTKLEAYYTTKEWLEDQATYINAQNGLPWVTKGGDHSVNVVAEFIPGSQTEQWFELDLTNALNDWVNGKRPNYGIWLRSNDFWEIASSENLDESLRPRLEITYQVVSLPPTVNLVRPNMGEQFSGTVDLVAASDSSDIVRLDFLVDNTIVGSTNKKSNDGYYHVSWDTKNISNGQHFILVRAFDSAGNAGESGFTTAFVGSFGLVNANGEQTTVQKGDGIIPPKGIDSNKTTATYNPTTQSMDLSKVQTKYNIANTSASSTRPSYDYLLFRATLPYGDSLGFWKSEPHASSDQKTKDVELDLAGISPEKVLHGVLIRPRNPQDNLKAHIEMYYNYKKVVDKYVYLNQSEVYVELGNKPAHHVDISFTNLSRDDISGQYHAEINQIRVFEQGVRTEIGSTMISGPLDVWSTRQFKKLGWIYTDAYTTTTGSYVKPVSVLHDPSTGEDFPMGESNVQFYDDADTVWVKSNYGIGIEPLKMWYFDGSYAVKEFRMLYGTPVEQEWEDDWEPSRCYSEPSWNVSNITNGTGSWISAGKANSTDMESIELTLDSLKDVNSIYIKPKFNGLNAKIYKVNSDGSKTLILTIDRLEDRTYYLPTTISLNKIYIEFTNLQRLSNSPRPTDYKYFAGLDNVAFMKTAAGTAGTVYSTEINLGKAVNQFQFKSEASAPQGGSIKFYYSTDGQDSSFSNNPIVSGELVHLSSPTQKLYLKAEMLNSNPEMSPELKLWSVSIPGEPVVFMTKNKENSSSPKVELHVPNVQNAVYGQVYVSAIINDDDPIKQVNFFVDNQLIFSTTEAPYQFVWNTVYETEGIHTLRAEAVDAYDNVGTSTQGQYFATFADIFDNQNNVDLTITKDVNIANGKVTLPTTSVNSGQRNGYVFSKNIEATTGKVITKVELNASKNVPVGTDIYYSISTGGNFVPISLGQEVTLDRPSTKVQLQAQLTTVNSVYTPELLDWNLEYVQSEALSVKVLSLANKPAIALTVSGNVYNLSGNVTLTATPINPIDLGHVEFLLDGELIGSVSGNVYSTTFDSTRISDGNHVLSARAYNPKGEFLPGSEPLVNVAVYNTGIPNSMLGLEDYWTYSAASLGNDVGYINVVNGNLSYTEDDLMLPSTRFAVLGSRSYNSSANWDSPYGYGWSINANYSLAFRSNGDFILNEGDGGQNYFVKNTNGSFTAPAGTFMVVTRDEAGNLVVERDDRIKLCFNSKGKLVKITEPNDNFINYTYNSLGLLDRMESNQGRWIKYNYVNGLLADISDSAGRKIGYTYDGQGNLKQVKDLMGNFINYEYDAAHNLTGVINAKGKKTKLEYLNEKVSVITDALGNSFRVTYDPTTNATTFSNPKNATFKYIYNSTGNVTKVESTDETGKKYVEQFVVNNNLVEKITNPKGYTTSMQYNHRGNLTEAKDYTQRVILRNTYDATGYNLIEAVDAKGNKTNFEYDAKGNLTKSWFTTYSYDTVGKVVYSTIYSSNVYDTIGNIVYSIDGRGNKTTYDYVYGNLVKVMDARGNYSRFTYDAAGNLSSASDPRGNMTNYYYDALGRLTKVVFPDGTSNEMLFDANGNVTSTKDNNGTWTKYAYDDLDRVVSVTDAENNRTEFGYDSIGNQIWVRDAKLVAKGDQRHTQEWAFNGLAQLKQQKDIVGHTVTYDYDVNGNLKTVEDHLANIVTADYDAYDRLIKYSYPIDMVNGTKRFGNTQFGYDVVGNKVYEINPLGYITRFNYNPLGQVISTTDAVYGTVYFGYDAVGNRVMIKDANGNATQYKYNDLNLLEKIIYPTDSYNPVQKEMTFSYDASGNQVKRIDQKNQITEYQYNSRNMLTDILYPDAKSVHFEYDGNGNRLMMKDSTGLTSYNYDKVGRLQSVTNPYKKTISYQYDQISNRTGMTVTDNNSLGQRGYTYTYDDLNRLKTVTEPGNKTTTLNYGSNLLLQEILFANGTKTVYQYNYANWLTGISTLQPNNTAVTQFDYTYYANGNKATMKDSLGNVTNYQYDPVDRLLSVTKDGKEQRSYKYDAVGNRTKMTNSIGTYDYKYDVQNKLRTVTEVLKANGAASTTTYGYDYNGNQITEAGQNGTTYFYYDAENRLVRIKYTNSAVPDTVSDYNGDGQRVRMNDDLNNTYYLYDGANVIADTDGTGVIQNYYLRGPSGNLFSMHSAGKSYYYATDGLGSTSAITDETGNIINKYSYDEFGVTSDVGGAVAGVNNPFKFTGAIHDANSNLYLMGARYYNPKVGRFITQDSYGAEYGADWTDHLYSYTSNNPVNMVDPTGHVAIPSFAKIVQTTYEGSFGLFHVGFFSTLKAKDLSDVAKANTIEYARKHKMGKTSQGDYIVWDNEADAYRHFTWNALMTRQIGKEDAFKIATAHEISAWMVNKEIIKENSKEMIVDMPLASLMDLYNNEQGRIMAQQYASRSTDDLFKLALKNNRVITSLSQVSGKYGFDKNLVFKDKSGVQRVRVKFTNGKMLFMARGKV